jgi:hydrogenase nickel incorporation protein HypB
MCRICGCSTDHFHAHDHAHDHQHPDGRDDHREHDHRDHVHAIEQRILARNDAIAAANRSLLAQRGVLALNLVSSPGAGKTTLLERTIRDMGASLAFSVIEGDQETDVDAQRLAATGCSVRQVNTGTGCHLDAAMVQRALGDLEPRGTSILMIENVGNLVCPALFDLGEHAKVVISSVTEGEDKPLKYPYMFRAAGLVVLNKIDLLPYVAFDSSRFVENVKLINPRLDVLALSATSGAGLYAWYGWLREHTRHGEG